MAISHSSVVKAPEHHTHIDDERCPLCDQIIPHDKFDEIHARIEAKERERTAELERRLKEQVAKDKAQAEAKAQAQIEQARKEAATAVAKIQEQAAAKEAAARDEARKAAEAAMTLKITQAEQAKKTAEQQLQAAKISHQSELSGRVQEVREALEKAKTEAINAERAKAFDEKLKLEAKLQELQRQVQNKTAGELGEGAEVDLFEELKKEFPGDQITRVKKGTAGADIIHKVVHNGRECGSIVYDFKN